jgi:hypothetical protein
LAAATHLHCLLLLLLRRSLLHLLLQQCLAHVTLLQASLEHALLVHYLCSLHGLPLLHPQLWCHRVQDTAHTAGRLVRWHALLLVAVQAVLLLLLLLPMALLLHLCTQQYQQHQQPARCLLQLEHVLQQRACIHQHPEHPHVLLHQWQQQQQHM